MQFSALRFTFTNLVMFLNLVLLLNGGVTLWVGFILILLLLTVIDELFGDTIEEEAPAPAWFLDLMALLTLPFLALNSLLYAFYFAPAGPSAMGALLGRFGIDFDGARAVTDWFDLLGGTLTLGMLYGWGMNVAHELVHRTTEPLFALSGRWLSAFSCESSFNLQHMTGHHVNIGIYEDPGTSRRGENIYAFTLRAGVGNNVFAWKSECERLRRKGLPIWSWRNQFLTGQAMTLLVAAVFWLVGGWMAVLAFLVVGVQGRFYLEAAAYVEHYRLVRVPGTRFEARHSWNSYRALSNGMLYNVERHADHHLFAARPYYKLRTDAAAPTLPHGYMTMFAFALIPPVFDWVMRPALADWDLNYATEAERRYIIEKGKSLWIPAPAE